MRQKYQLYYEALETNKEAFAHGLFIQAYQSLSTALHYAFHIQSPRILIRVERLALEQLGQVEEHFAPLLSSLEPVEVSNYRVLVELAATRRALVEGATQGDALTITSSCVDGHKFEDTTTIDARSGVPVSSYTIDNVPTEPGTWDTKYITAQEHEKTAASIYD